MPDKLKEFLKSLKSKDAYELWVWLDGNQLAADWMIEIIYDRAVKYDHKENDHA